MPFHRDFDRDDRILRTTITGPVTLQEIDIHLRIIRRRRADMRPELIDARRAGPGALSARQILLAAHRARFVVGGRSPARRAVVVSSDAGAVIARRVAAFVAGWLRIGVFDDIDAAEEWVGQPAWSEALLRMSRVASL
jgi:hypothetical protein